MDTRLSERKLKEAFFDKNNHQDYHGGEQKILPIAYKGNFIYQKILHVR